MAQAEIQHLLPHDKEAEQALLGAVMLKNNAIYEVMDHLTVDHFFSPGHKEIFQVMLELVEAGQAIDEITVSAVLRTKSRLEQVGGGIYLGELSSRTPVSSNVMVYAGIIEQKFYLRNLITTAMEIAKKGREEGENAFELIQKAEQMFARLSSQGQHNQYAQLKDLFIDSFDQLENLNAEGQDLGLPTGFIELDGLIHGLKPGALIIVAARPSMGKTSLALNVAYHALQRSGKAGVIFSLEMSKQQLALRLLCSEGKIDSQKLEPGGDKLTPHDWDTLTEAARKMEGVKLFIDDTPELSPMGLRSIVRRIQAEHEIGLIVVDYLQLMRTNLSVNSREQEISEISRNLKSIAKEFNVPLIACAQLNRALENRPDKRPRLSDLRESGSIEQDADIVMFIYRDEVYNKESEDSGVAEIHLAKHRTGPITTSKQGIRLVFMPTYTKFANFSFREEDGGTYN